MCSHDELLLALDEEVTALTVQAVHSFRQGELAWLRGDMSEANRLATESDILSRAADAAQERLTAEVLRRLGPVKRPRRRRLIPV